MTASDFEVASCPKCRNETKLQSNTSPPADINTLLAAAESPDSFYLQLCSQCLHCRAKGILASCPQFGQLFIRILSLLSFKILSAV